MSKGVGFVSFLDKADCERAITELHGSRLEGSDSQRPIRVEVIGQPVSSWTIKEGERVGLAR